MTDVPILYGPDSLAFETFDPVSPAPGNNGSGGQVAYRGRWPLGTQLVHQDGRKYRFALNGATLQVIGDVVTSAAIISTDQSMAAAATAIGARSITFTHGAATVVINYFAEGYATVSLAPGAGQVYRIASHAALTSGGADTVNLAPGHAVRVALTTTSDISLLAHPYAGIIQSAATTLTGAPVGVAVSAIPVGDFGFVQTRGSASVLTVGTLVVGARAIVPTATAGGVGPSTAATDSEVGLVQMVEATTEWSGIFLTIDG